MNNLDIADFIKRDAHIDGQWIAAPQRFPVISPATGDCLAEVVDANSTLMEQAIEVAFCAFSSWRSLTPYERSGYLSKLAKSMEENADSLARLITLEQGKPLVEARAEVMSGASMVRFYAEEATRQLGQLAASPHINRRNLIIRQPVGVVGAITPWNFPVAMVARKLAPALAAGCTLVLKPAPDTPLSALALANLAEQSGLPPGVFNVVPTTRAQAAGEILCQSKKVSKLTFTGSTEVGQKLYAQCGRGVKRLSLELGGNAPFIVFKDADLDRAIDGLIASKFRNAGQTCVCANRILVDRTLTEEFKAKLVKAVQVLRVGDGLDSKTDIGPLINQAAVEKAKHLLAQAINAGANTVWAAEADQQGTFFPPVILDEITPQMLLFQQEIFAPILAISYFSSDDEALQLANQSDYGLAAYFYTRDLAKCWRFAEQLEYGIVGVNEGVVSSSELPFGGYKLSGVGREGGVEGLMEYLETKSISMNIGY